MNAIIGPNSIALEQQNEDDAYQEHIANGEPTEAPRCRYVDGKTCDCRGRWTCLEVA